ncbi:MAG: ABC transporter permease [Nakamurella sp.]
MTASMLTPGRFTPQPGRATAVAMVRAAAAQELRIMARNGEQLVLAYLIPLAALIGMTTISVGVLPVPRVATVTPGVLALAIMSASFASQAIITGFDRRYGVMKRLAATGFPRWLLLASKCLATSVVIIAQFLLLCLVAWLAFNWQPKGNPLWAVLVTVLGIAAFIGLALLLGGTLRAEAVLGLTNVVWLFLVGIGGVLIPLTSAPDWLQTVGGLTPAGALSNGLRAVLTDGGGPGATNIVILVCWIALGWAGTVRWFRWQ